MRIAQRSHSFDSSLYDKSGKTVFHIETSKIYLVGKDNSMEPSTWWFYQNTYRNSDDYMYGNISFKSECIRITINHRKN